MKKAIRNIERFERARLARLIDRPRCDSPEIGIIGEGEKATEVAANLRRMNIAVATYWRPLRRQLDAARADDVDQLLFIDSMKLKCAFTGEETMLGENYADDALRALILGYLPSERAVT